MPANTYGRQVVEALTNKSGGGVIAGDVVVIDTTNNGAFTTSAAGAFTGLIGVAQETIANNNTGRVLTSGYAALVNTSASVTRGNFGKTHTVVKQAVDAGASRVAGAFCQFLTGGTTPDAHVFGIADSSTGGGGGGGGTPVGPLLAYVYDTVSGISVNITSTTLVDVDATNAVTPSFIAPASGHVVCRITGTATNDGSINCYVGVREGSTILGSKVFATNTQNLKDEQFSALVDITGLTPGTAHTFKIAAATNSGTFTLRSSATTPLSMEVYDAAPSTGGSTPTFIGAKAYSSATQGSIAATTMTKVTLNAEEYDTSTFHDNTTNNTRMTVPTTGYYSIKGYLYGASSGGGRVVLGNFFKNNTTVLRGQPRFNEAVTGFTITLACTQPLTAGDFIELRVWCSASDLTLGDATNIEQQCWLSVELIGV